MRTLLYGAVPPGHDVHHQRDHLATSEAMRKRVGEAMRVLRGHMS